MKTEYEHVLFKRYSIFGDGWNFRKRGAKIDMGELDSTGDITLYVSPFAGAARTNPEELRDILSFMESLESNQKGTTE